MLKFLKVAILILAITACKNQTNKKEETAIPEPEKEASEWKYLFDGSSLEGWRGYGMDSLPPGWTIRDSILTFDTELGLEQDYTGGKDIVYGAEEFDNFELYYEIHGTGTPVILVPGLAGIGDYWTPQIKALAKYSALNV